MLFRRRRQRRIFSELALAEVQRVAPLVGAAEKALARELDATATALKDVTGRVATCPRCGSQMRLGPMKVGRKWFTLWSCNCGATYRPSQFPKESRLAGRR